MKKVVTFSNNTEIINHAEEKKKKKNKKIKLNILGRDNIFNLSFSCCNNRTKFLASKCLRVFASLYLNKINFTIFPVSRTRVHKFIVCKKFINNRYIGNKPVRDWNLLIIECFYGKDKKSKIIIMKNLELFLSLKYEYVLYIRVEKNRFGFYYFIYNKDKLMTNNFFNIPIDYFNICCYKNCYIHKYKERLIWINGRDYLI